MIQSLGNEEKLVEIPAFEFFQNLPDCFTYIHGAELSPEKGECDSWASVIFINDLPFVVPKCKYRSYVTEAKLNKYLSKRGFDEQ